MILFRISLTVDAVNRPVIRLVDNAPGFQDSDIAKSIAVLELQQEDSDSEGCLFW